MVVNIDGLQTATGQLSKYHNPTAKMILSGLKIKGISDSL